MNQTPANAFLPGTIHTVGSHQVSILKYISQGGFAHVYTCKIEPPFRNEQVACLKRVIVPTKDQLTLLRQEVDAMKRLRGNAHIVSYIDSHASRLPSQSPDQTQKYEVLLLMEYCSGLGLIDFMNTRLTQRLSEREVLSIMGQITTAVAMCHHLEPPIIHRDIKIENLLVDGNGTYKLCDFGSAVNYTKVPSNQQELQLLYDDIMKHTTPQYRAPEMIDLSRALPIDDKSDVWALGIFLYKLCYFTTPFELPNHRSIQDLEQLILACLKGLRFPLSPRYSSRLQNVINCCLREDPRRRPNALQLLQEVCKMQNISVLPEIIPYSVKVQHMNSISLANPPEHKLMPLKLEDEHKKKAPTDSSGDVFSKIDKSMLLKIWSNPSLKPSPKSEIYHRTRGSFSSNSLHDMVEQQVKATSQELSNMRKYDDRGQDTIEFLRSKEEAGITSRQNTGGSIKASIRNGLRNFSTGGSIKSQRSVAVNFTNHFGKENNQEDTTKSSGNDEPKKRFSIQRRVQQLLYNKDKKATKTATGYGRYTDQDDISAINKYERTNSVVSESNLPESKYSPPLYDFNRKSVTPKTSHIQTQPPHTAPGLSPSKSRHILKKSNLQPPPCPPSLLYRIPKEQFEAQSLNTTQKEKKRPPPKPSKPQHLKVDESRNFSKTSEIFLPDLDDLEKGFSQRYPSYV